MPVSHLLAPFWSHDLQAIALATLTCALSVAPLCRAADGAPGEEPPREREPSANATRTLVSTPVGVDTYTAFLGEKGYGVAALGMVTAGSEVSGAGATDLSGGLRLWGGFLDRMTVLGEGSKTEKGRYAPSLTVAVRVLGDRRANWGIGILGRYRTEGFSTIDGEVEAGFLGSYVKSGLHLDAGVLAGKGLEEEEADAEVLARFGYDVFPVLRLGLEGRVRHELGKEPAAATTGGDTGEWDALAGAQASVAYDHFFLTLTLGSQKPRLSEQLGFVGHVVVGGVAF